MKKYFYILAAAVALCMAVGCGGNTEAVGNDETKTATESSGEKPFGDVTTGDGLLLPNDSELIEENGNTSVYKTDLAPSDVDMYYCISTEMTVMSEEISDDVFTLGVVMDEKNYKVVIADKNGGSEIKVTVEK